MNLQNAQGQVRSEAELPAPIGSMELYIKYLSDIKSIPFRPILLSPLSPLSLLFSLSNEEFQRAGRGTIRGMFSRLSFRVKPFFLLLAGEYRWTEFLNHLGSLYTTNRSIKNQSFLMWSQIMVGAMPYRKEIKL